MTTTAPAEPDLELILEHKQAIAESVVELTLRHPNQRPLPAWEPGAHIDLVLGDDLVRQYSLCGDPRDLSAFQVAVLREPEGRGGSRHVHEALQVGHRIRVRGPRNHFPLVDAKRYVFIAGGIGITPLKPMVAEIAATGREWALVYGGRHRTSMAYLDELEQRYPGQVDIYPEHERGRINLAGALGEPGADWEQTAVYCCGPESLLEAVEAYCATWPEGILNIERFAPKPDAADGRRTAFQIELAQTGRVLDVPSERSILDIIEEAGVPVLSSCQEGTCGTCETVVLSGTPDHRDSILTEAEKQTGETMMICVSRSCSARLVLDL
ncbi:PDR/VanB family oxidoreductase [Nocardia sp. CA-120079]|uniref:PDR/VanB family oxidoreductase n=1 Tax=Nocardia sp. CA-120079 TaxID=3239974 RepID=UPI003D974252